MNAVKPKVGDRVVSKDGHFFGEVDEVQDDGNISVVWDISGCVSEEKPDALYKLSAYRSDKTTNVIKFPSIGR